MSYVQNSRSGSTPGHVLVFGSSGNTGSRAKKAREKEMEDERELKAGDGVRAA